MTDPCGQSRTPAHFGDPRKTARQPQDLCRSRRGQTVFLTVLCIAKKKRRPRRAPLWRPRKRATKICVLKDEASTKAAPFPTVFIWQGSPCIVFVKKKRLVAGQVEDHMNGLAIRDAIGTDVAVVVERGAGTL